MNEQYREAMGKALFLANRARETGDVPVGAVVVDEEGRIIGRGWNCREANHDPAGHAEIVALREAGRARGTWRLTGCTLIVTLEPCTMCAGAILASRIDRVVFGAWDPKAGAAGSLRDVLRDARMPHPTEVVGGVLAQEAAMQLRSFFLGCRTPDEMPVVQAPVHEPGDIVTPIVVPYEEDEAPEPINEEAPHEELPHDEGVPAQLVTPAAPAGNAPGASGVHDPAEASSVVPSNVVPSNEESVLSQAAAIVDSFAPGSDYALHVQNENNDGTLPQHPDINQDPAAPSRYQPGHRLGTIVTVWGTHGAPGRSTIAFNLAALAAQQGQQVCLIDADTYAPSLDALMALEDTGSGLAILCSDADRAQLDEKKAGAIMERVPLKNGTFDFLSGITSSSRWPEVRARAFAEVLEWLKHRYDLVICDVAAPIEVDEELTFDGPAPRRNAATLTALACADRVIALGEADVIGLPRLINLAREVQSRPDLFAPETDVQYWLNRSRREAAGFNPEAKMRDNWARYLSVPLTGVIPYERKVMDRLRRNGEALLEVAPRHAVVQSLEAMLEGMYAVRAGA